MSKYADRINSLDDRHGSQEYRDGYGFAVADAADIAAEADREIQMLRDTLETCLDCLGDEFALPSDVIDEVRGALKR